AVVTRTTSQFFQGLAALQLSSSAGGDMTARTASGLSGIPVIAGSAYAFQARARSAVSARSVSVGVRWYDAAGAQTGSDVYGADVTNNTVNWTPAPFLLTT